MPDTLPHGAAPLPAAVAAFDGMAEGFDARFGEWASVAAQRRAVRRHLLAAFAPGALVLELAGGTGEDALFLARNGRSVLLTDGSPTMVERAAAKVRAAGLEDRVSARQLVLEEIASFDARGQLDGAFSNFAGLNCVKDLRAVASGLARLLPPEASALLVVFGPLPPGEVITQLVRGQPRAAFRRLQRASAPARINGRAFQVHYATPRAFERAFAPWFTLRRMRGIGVAVPPSAAEPFISRLPTLVRALEAVDRVVAAPLALLGDHVLLHFERTGAAVES